MTAAFMVGAKHAGRNNTLRSPAEKIIGGRPEIQMLFGALGLVVCGGKGDAAEDFAGRCGPNRREMAQSAGRQGRGGEQIGDLDELVGVGALIAIGAKG
jgi:hypothetical protein